jgi:hypothetical protein
MKEKLMNDLKEAMKNKDTIRKNTIQSIRASILQYEKDKQIEADNNKILDIIASELKKRNDALEQFTQARRKDLINDCCREISILKEYLPKQLSDEELENEIDDIIANNEKNMGVIMKAAKERIGNKADGKRIAAIVKERLNRE